MAILGFSVCAIIILLAGSQLSRYGDMISDKTGLGRAFIGLILISAVTSLPELMVGISSSAIVQSADLATGDILGSCAFNLSLISIMELFSRKRSPLLNNVSQTHILAASLGIILFAFVGFGLFLHDDITILRFIGLNSLLFALIYFLALRMIYRHQKRNPGLDEERKDVKLSLSQIIFRYALFALITIAAALLVPHFADQIAEQTGMGKSFVGTLFLAISTSLPEIAVTIFAVRMGAADMAVGNVLGSNIFNIFILFIDDLFYTKGHLLKDASEHNMLTVLTIVVMSAIAIVGITYKHQKTVYFLGWDTMLMLLIFIINFVLLYRLDAI